MMTAHEQNVFSDLLAEVQKLRTKWDHPAIVSGELYGYCQPRRVCGPRCIALNRTLRDAEALVATFVPPLLALVEEGRAS